MIELESICKFRNDIKENLYDDLNCTATQFVRIRNKFRIFVNIIYNIKVSLKKEIK